MDDLARVLLVSGLLLLAGCSAGPTSAPAGPNATGDAPAAAGDGDVATVTEVTDGDTLKMQYQDGSTETVRLLGVDTPEVHVANDPSEFDGVPETEAGRDWLRDWGHKASEFVRVTVGGADVRVVVDEQSDRRGSYGRLLAYVYHDGELLNQQLIEQGYARMYDSTFSLRERFAASERTAREDGIGLWGFEDGASNPAADEESEGLAVATIHADAEGNDNENLNDEYVVFENAGEQPLELSGWTIRDEADHTYRFPDGFVLDAGSRVTVHSGNGTDSDTDLYWESDGALWNNGGDTVTVRNEEGTVVLSESY